MFKETILPILAAWFILTAVPILAIWTVGLPLVDTWFWFTAFETSMSIAWGWLVVVALFITFEYPEGTD